MSTARRPRMIARWSAALAATGLAVAAVAGCDATPPAGTDAAHQVTVVGSGQVQGVPDTLTVDAGIEFTAPDVKDAMQQLGNRQLDVVNALLDAGISRENIATTQVSVQPQYGGSDSAGGNTITGYRAGHTLRVKVEADGQTASQVLAVITRAGGDATRINGVSYSIDDDSQLVRQARERAFNDAKSRAEQYAELSGQRLGKVISISEVAEGGAPTPAAPAPRTALAAPTPEPGQQTVSFAVTAVWELS